MNDKAKSHNYLLRGINEPLWIKMRHFCVDNNLTTKAFMLNSIVFYIEYLVRLQEAK